MAQDGILARIRVPGGLLSAEQCHFLAEVDERLQGSVDVTNRANIQIRGLQQNIPAELLSKFQAVGLAAPLAEVDHLRNIMASPTAGIDPAQQIDTRPLVRDLDRYLSSHPHLAGLSSKFSIGIDGGEQVSIAQQPNDLLFSAIQSGSRFSLKLEGGDSTMQTLWLKPKECLPFVAALAQIYLEAVESEAVESAPNRKPRLKHILQTADIQRFLERIQQRLSFPLTLAPSVAAVTAPSAPAPSIHNSSRFHLGAHPQVQRDFFYIGVALPLGRLTAHQLHQLAELADTYGQDCLRLTPWRNLLVCNIPEAHLDTVQRSLEQSFHPGNSIWGGLVACSGRTGCISSATDTQADAAAIAQAVTRHLVLDQPLTIHLSGCDKSCAHHSGSDIALVGIQSDEGTASYRLYVGDCDTPFGRELTVLQPEELPERVAQLLSIYQQQRTSSYQSFRDFANQSGIGQLQQWLTAEELPHA
jgi:ferredoxin-nitrite reductase